MPENIKTRGGRRIGAGRKKVSEPRLTHPIRYSDKEWAMIAERARLENKNPSEYIRMKSLQ